MVGVLVTWRKRHSWDLLCAGVCLLTVLSGFLFEVGRDRHSSLAVLAAAGLAGVVVGLTLGIFFIWRSERRKQAGR
jgi:ABC-type proline/glycine betaine transport system permease subunit